jgi:hypothetical protein
MNQKLRVVLAALVLVGLAVTAMAQDIPKGVLQLPDMTTGWNLQSQWDLIDGEPNIIRADNWRCPDGRPVTDVHWWGSYYFNTDGGNPVDAFEISIYDNDGSNGLPGTLLYRQNLNLAAVNETAYGVDTNGEEVYQYTAYLENPFQQTQGEIYWLSIVALTEGTTRWPMWGWHTAVNTDIETLLQGAAQSTKDPDSENPIFGGQDANPWQDAQYDMAFELTTIPEPSLIALFGLGLFAIWTRFRRR